MVTLLCQAIEIQEFESIYQKQKSIFFSYIRLRRVISLRGDIRFTPCAAVLRAVWANIIYLMQSINILRFTFVGSKLP